MDRERIMLAGQPGLSVLNLEAAREHGRVTVAEAARLSGASRNTIKVHMKARAQCRAGAWYGLS